MSRAFAFQVEDGQCQMNSIYEIANKMKSKFPDNKVLIFKKMNISLDPLENVDIIDMPDDCDNSAKMKNFILDYAKKNVVCTFFHLVEANICIDDGIDKFIAEVEHTMDVLDYSIYFSTSTDKCNYVYSKMNPRISIDLDDDDCKKLGLPEKICFTSHSNTVWISYDFSRLPDVPKFDERFSIMMYVIIEYLARRRSSKDESQLYFMNQYLSIPSEQYAFHLLDTKNDPPDPDKMKAEDVMFKSMNVDYSPDNNIDIILEMFHKKIQDKMNCIST